MMTSNRIKTVLVLAAMAITGSAFNVAAEGRPLKVYILAGQSNMEGHAKVETFDYIGDDSATAPLLKEMRGPDGKPRVCEKVWISYLTGPRNELGEGIGKLTAGYGARKEPAEDGGKIGPEFTFGITMEKATDGPILLIKTAWGGKSLHTDFRSPSAGPYEFSEAQLARLKDQSKDIGEIKADKVKATGRYYRLMTDHVKKVLADIKRVYPDYDPKQGYELAGFVWFQGWNDMVDSGTYPNRSEPDGYAKYSEWMADFIRDVRKDLGAPKMPFVIGVMGVGGVQEEPNYFRQAMALIGKAFAEALHEMELKAALDDIGRGGSPCGLFAEPDAKPSEQSTMAIELYADMALGLCNEQAAAKRATSLKGTNFKDALKQECLALKSDLVRVHQVTAKQFTRILESMKIVSSSTQTTALGVSHKRAYLETTIFLDSDSQYVAVVTTELAGLPKEIVEKLKK